MTLDAELMRISQIATRWPLVNQAHLGAPEQRTQARQQLLQRYDRAVRAYLVKVLRNPDAADEVYQEFALRVVRGDLQRADPSRGRFRNFVKTTIYHLIVDYQRREKARPRLRQESDPEPIWEPPELAQMDQALLHSWREEFLVRGWQLIEKAEQEGGSPHHSVLRVRIENPDLKSPELAEALSKRLGKPVTAVNWRKMLDRARHELSVKLLEQVVAARAPQTRADLLEELTDLGLSDVCLNAAAEWNPPTK
jgi:RNA polymerase sigma-70 factor (ECF subfamily)